MQKASAIVRIAYWTAFAMAALIGISVLSGLYPAALLSLAIINLVAGVGVLRRRVWSAYGYALLTLSQLLLVPLVLLRGGGPAPGELAASALFSSALAILFFFAGRSLDHAGAVRGWPAPWIVASALLTLPLLLVQPFVIPTGSMEDTLLIGDKILVQRLPSPRLVWGSVMAFAYPVDQHQTHVKRLIGLPGDRIRIENKVVYRNGSALRESYAVHKTDYMDSYRDNFPSEPNIPLSSAAQEMLARNVVRGEIVVPKGKYFVLGDNRDSSYDSRYWGFVSAGDFIGRPLIIYDSVNQAHRVRWARLFKRLY